MSWNENAGKKASAVAMALCLSGIASPLAWAANGYTPGQETGSIVVEKVSGDLNENLSLHGYKLFKADVATDASRNNVSVASRIEWEDGDTISSTAIRAIVEAAATEFAGTAMTFETADEAARYIETNIAASTAAEMKPDSGSGEKKLATGTFGKILADKLAASSLTKAITGLTAGGAAATGLGEGYYLLVSDAAGDEEDAIGTSPIFALVNHDQAVDVTIKTAKVPTVNKEITTSGALNTDPDSTKTGDKEAIATKNAGEAVDFKLTGTLPDNYASYNEYFYKFTDTLNTPLMFVSSAEQVVVKVGGVTIAHGTGDAQANVVINGDVLTVTINDLKKIPASAVAINNNTVITVEYKAQLDPSNSAAATGLDGATKNIVGLEYSNDPHGDGHGKTSEPSGDPEDPGTGDRNQIINYQVTLTKLDRASSGNKVETGSALLQGAKFTVKKGEKFVTRSGALVSSSTASNNTVFTTDANGNINLFGLGDGTYTIHETQAPDGYDTMAVDLTLVIATIEKSGGQLEMSATLSGGDGDYIASTAQGATVADGTGTRLISFDINSGEIALKATDPKKVYLPGTGLDGIMIGAICSGILLVVALAMYIVRFRRKFRQDKLED